jgi:hypothetical protein
MPPVPIDAFVLPPQLRSPLLDDAQGRAKWNLESIVLEDQRGVQIVELEEPRIF